MGISLKKLKEKHQADPRRLDWLVNSKNMVVYVDVPSGSGWRILLPPITYLTKAHEDYRDAIDEAMKEENSKQEKLNKMLAPWDYTS